MSPLHRLISRHPFDFIPPGWWPRFFWPLLGLTILLMFVMGVTGSPLTTEAAPYGVVSFELAGSVENAQNIMNSWDADAELRAAFGLGLDYLFMVSYASTIAFGCGIVCPNIGSQRLAFCPLGKFAGLGRNPGSFTRCS